MKSVQAFASALLVRAGVRFGRLGFIGLIGLVSVAHSAMDTPGQFAVSPTGAATYSIALQVPPGVAGIEPKLSLEYNSQSGNGLMGMGWNLSGLSSISRCPRTVAQDAQKGGLNYDWNDRYCLDGQRLVVVSGSYGGNGSEYRTEIESFSKIISYGTTGNGPSWFKVWTKSGLIMEYGNTADSFVEAQGKPTARIWALNKVSDTKGNYMSVSYSEDTTNGQSYPISIWYGGNSNVGNGHAHGVNIEYLARPDIEQAYVAGSLIKTVYRVSNIKTYANATLVKDYRLSYEQSSLINRSRVTSIQECDASGASCLLPTTVAWSNSGWGLTSSQWQSHPSTEQCYPAQSVWIGGEYGWYYIPAGCYQDNYGILASGANWVDLNGDGKLDYVTMSGGAHYVSLSTGSGYTNQIWSGHSLSTSGAHWVDLNGDGKADYVTNDQYGNHYVSLSTGTGYTNTQWQGHGLSTSGAHWVDLNGDGKADYVTNDSYGNHYISLSNGNGYEPQQTWQGHGIASSGATWVDLNGDGKADYVTTYGDGAFYVSLSTGTGYNNQTWYGHGLSTSGVHWADLNGDGLTDYVTNDGSGNHYVSLSTGTGFDNQTWSGHGIAQGGAQWTDLNGDGKADYVTTGADGAHYISLSTGSGYESTTWYGHGLSTSGVHWVDLNGDGLADYVTNDAAGNHYVSLRIGGAMNLATTIKSGLGAEVRPIYYALPMVGDGNRYYKQFEPAYPNVFVSSPLQIVTDIDVSDGVGGSRRTNYWYGTGVADQTGRGFLGFDWVQSQDVSTGIISRNWYKRDFPYTGQVDVAAQWDSNWNVKAVTSNFYACNDFNAGCSVTPGRRYFPYIEHSDTHTWDWNGVKLPITQNFQTYDAYGNATSVETRTMGPNWEWLNYVKTTTNTYASPDLSNWILGRLIRSTVTSTQP